MDTLKLTTLDQIEDALDAVEDARGGTGLSDADEFALATASLKLRDMERSIIRSLEKDLVNTLTLDSAALKDLTDQINQSAGKLDDIATVLTKTTKIVDALISVVSTALGSGLI